MVRMQGFQPCHRGSNPLGSTLYSTGLAFGMEFKDKQYGGKFDWLDIAATEIGGLIGQILQIGLIYLIYIIYGNT